jgi:hypothetical protein
MEVLRFDSRMPNPKYLPTVRDLAGSLPQAPLVCQNGPRTAAKESGMRAFEFPMAEALPALAPVA